MAGSLLAPERLKRRGRHRRSTVAQAHDFYPFQLLSLLRRFLGIVSEEEEEAGLFALMSSAHVAARLIEHAHSTRLLANP